MEARVGDFDKGGLPQTGSASAVPRSTSVSPETVPTWMQTTEEQTELAQPMNLGSLAFRMFVATIGVLVAAGLSIYLGRQWLEKRQPPELAGNQIRIVETRALAPRSSVKLIEAAGQMVLVAMDSRGIQGLVPLTSTFDDVWEEAEQTVSPIQEPQVAASGHSETRRPLRGLATR